MFLTLQFPATDARAFSQTETGKLSQPVWSSPDINREFVRSFGNLKKRNRGGAVEWLNEDKFCSATNALKFLTDFSRTIRVDEKVLLKRKCVFRRFLADTRFENENIIYRTEIGLELGWKSIKKKKNVADGSGGNEIRLDLSEENFLKLIGVILNQKIRINTEPDVECELYDAGKYLAELILRASTEYAETAHIQKWWLCPGKPLIVLEYDPYSEFIEFPAYAKIIKSDTLPGIELRYFELEIKNVIFGIWLVGGDLLEYDFSQYRQLRLNLLRFHAELQAIKRIFRLIVTEKIEIDVEADATERLQDYLNRSIKLLEKQSAYGLPQTPILEVVQASQDLIAGGEREQLLARLENIRGNILKKIQKFSSNFQEKPNQPVAIYILEKGSIDLSSQILKVAGNVSGSIYQTSAEKIEGSFNTEKNKEVTEKKTRKVEKKELYTGPKFEVSKLRKKKEKENTNMSDNSEKEINTKGKTQTVDVGGSVGEGINQVIARDINNSFNRVQNSENASDELKEKFAELNKQIEELLPKLSEADQKKVSKNLDILTNEAAEEKPDKKWYELSADGLIEAAKTVAEMSGPIITTVKAILAILA